MSAEDQIRQYAERIVRLEQERKSLAEDIKECKAEAKAAGFSPKLIATCVRIMLMEAEKRAEALSGHEELDLYLGAVGLIARGESNEIRRDAGGRGQRASTADSGVPVPANVEAAKVVVRAAQRASATDFVIRSSETGRSVKLSQAAQADREVQAGVVRETGASVWAPQNAAPGFQPVSQDAGQPDHARVASDEARVWDRGFVHPGQSEECVAVAGAGEGPAPPRDPASAPNASATRGGS